MRLNVLMSPHACFFLDIFSPDILYPGMIFKFVTMVVTPAIALVSVRLAGKCVMPEISNVYARTCYLLAAVHGAQTQIKQSTYAHRRAPASMRSATLRPSACHKGHLKLAPDHDA